MMDTSTDLVHRARSVRIAIAVAALRHKPPRQSFDSYVLDLRARFITKETAVAEYEVWRTRALELEKKLQEVEEKYQGEHVELAALQAKILSSEVRPSSPPANSKSKGQKKKAGQKKPAVVPNPVHATFNLDALQVPPLFEPHNILSSLQNLEVLAGPLRDDRKKLPCDAFVSACHRALDSLTALLVSGLRTADDRTASALDTLLRLSPQLITLVLPILARVPRKKKRGSPSEATPAPDCSAHAAILDRFVGSLATSLLVPLVHSFASSSIAFYAVAISEPPKKPHSTLLAPKHQTSEIRLQPADVRPRLSSLLHALVDALVKLCASGPSSTASTATAGEQRRLSSLVGHTVDFVTLESVRALENLYADASSHRTTTTTTTSTNTSTSIPVGETPSASLPLPLSSSLPLADLRRRVMVKLARKDALWYLCQALHLLMGSARSLNLTRGKGTSLNSVCGASMLGDPIYTGVSALLRRTRQPEAAEGEGEGGEDVSMLGCDGDAGGEGDCGVRRGMLIMDEGEREMVLAVVEKYWLEVA